MSTIHHTAKALRSYALGFPGATEEFPWGERVVKVDKKVFVFLGHEDGKDWGLSVKLPRSAALALGLPFTKPTGYNLGKSGWISASFDADEDPPLELLRPWIEESYRAVAPKRRIKELDEGGPLQPLEAAKTKTPAAKGAKTKTPAAKGAKTKTPAAQTPKAKKEPTAKVAKAAKKKKTPAAKIPKAKKEPTAKVAKAAKKTARPARAAKTTAKRSTAKQ